MGKVAAAGIAAQCHLGTWVARTALYEGPQQSEGEVERSTAPASQHSTPWADANKRFVSVPNHPESSMIEAWYFRRLAVPPSLGVSG